MIDGQPCNSTRLMHSFPFPLQTAQEVSTMLRYGTNPIILLINNGG